MNSIWTLIKQILPLPANAKPPANEPDPSFAYRLYWVKETRDWPQECRSAVAQSLAQLVESESFHSSLYHREYTVDGLGDGAHAGESLFQLLRVLRHLLDDSHTSGE